MGSYGVFAPAEVWKWENWKKEKAITPILKIFSSWEAHTLEDYRVEELAKSGTFIWSMTENRTPTKHLWKAPPAKTQCGAWGASPHLPSPLACLWIVDLAVRASCQRPNQRHLHIGVCATLPPTATIKGPTPKGTITTDPLTLIILIETQEERKKKNSANEPFVFLWGNPLLSKSQNYKGFLGGLLVVKRFIVVLGTNLKSTIGRETTCTSRPLSLAGRGSRSEPFGAYARQENTMK